MYQPKHLQKWRRCSNYIGEDYSDYYCIAGHSRDSDILEESNYQSIKKYLQSENVAYEEISASHWAVGWVESIIIHESNDAGLVVGDDIAKRLEDYPIFNEDDYSRREWEKVDSIMSDIMQYHDGDIARYFGIDPKYNLVSDEEKWDLVFEYMDR